MLQGTPEASQCALQISQGPPEHPWVPEITCNDASQTIQEAPQRGLDALQGPPVYFEAPKSTHKAPQLDTVHLRSLPAFSQVPESYLPDMHYERQKVRTILLLKSNNHVLC